MDLFDLAITSQVRDGNRLFHTNFLKAEQEFYGNRDSNYLGKDRYEICISMITKSRCWITRNLSAPWSVIKYVIELFGEDPSSVTAATMDKKHTRLYCTESCNSDNVRVLMNWRAAVSY